MTAEYKGYYGIGIITPSVGWEINDYNNRLTPSLAPPNKVRSVNLVVSFKPSLL